MLVTDLMVAGVNSMFHLEGTALVILLLSAG